MKQGSSRMEKSLALIYKNYPIKSLEVIILSILYMLYRLKIGTYNF